uniref:Isoflavone 2'-hydroxylase n=1 Tax=Triticum urartu TaxID=4572 RepID=A0A8R7TRJ8_TRIUA
MLVLTVVMVSATYLLMRRMRGKKRLPPGPGLALPLVGHLHLLREKPLHVTLAGLATRHGPLLSLCLGRRDAVVVTSLRLAKECFSSELDVNFANRPRFPSAREVSFGYTGLSAASYGPHWRAMRRIATVHLLSARRVDLMSDAAIAGETRAMVRRLARAAAGGFARVELKRNLFELSHGVLMEAIAGTKGTRAAALDADMSEEAHEFKKVVDEIVPLLGMANLHDHLPAPLRWLDLGGVRWRLTELVNRRNALMHSLIDAERQRRRQEDHAAEELLPESKSMIGVMLQLQESDPQQYTDTFIAALVTVSTPLLLLRLVRFIQPKCIYPRCSALLCKEPLRRRHGDHVGDHGMGHVAAAQPAGRAAEGARGGERACRPRPPPRQGGPPPPPLPPVHNQRDPAALPRRATAVAARVLRRLQPPWLPPPGGHHAARQRLRHPPGPVRVGRPRGVQAREVRRQWRRPGP